MAIQEVNSTRPESRLLARWGEPLGVLCWVVGLGCSIAALNWFSISQGYAHAPDGVNAAVAAASRGQAYGLGGIVLLVAGCYLRPPIRRS